MKIIHDVLRECGYSAASAFSFTYWRGQEECAHQVIPFLSEFASRDGYLLVPVSGAELPHLLDGDFLASIMRELGRQAFYSPDMDRNTTLLLICRRADGEQIDHGAKVQIEDDPYYFKKYVFAYTEREEAAALSYIAGRSGSLTEILRACLLDTERFAGYKDHTAEAKKPAAEEKKKPARGRKKAAAEPEAPEQDNLRTDEDMAYGFFVELATKITVLPIRPGGTMEIRSMEGFWQEELQKAPVANLAAVERVLELDPDELNDVLAKWRELNPIGCE